MLDKVTTISEENVNMSEFVSSCSLVAVVLDQELIPASNSLHILSVALFCHMNAS